MLRSLQIDIVGVELYQFIEAIDYNGFLEAGGTAQQWEKCINALYDGYKPYSGEGSYLEYLKERDNWLDRKYDAFDAEKVVVESENTHQTEVKSRRSADIRQIIEFVTRYSGQVTPNRIFLNCLDPWTKGTWFTDLVEVNKLVTLLVRDGTLYYPTPGYLGVL